MLTTKRCGAVTATHFLPSSYRRSVGVETCYFPVYSSIQVPNHIYSMTTPFSCRDPCASVVTQVPGSAYS